MPILNPIFQIPTKIYIVSNGLGTLPEKLGDPLGFIRTLGLQLLHSLGTPRKSQLQIAELTLQFPNALLVLIVQLQIGVFGLNQFQMQLVALPGQLCIFALVRLYGQLQMTTRLVVIAGENITYRGMKLSILPSSLKTKEENNLQFNG